ncbi:MAG: TRASH domain-containing protein [Candidatus Hydrothermarchaeota archaeon]
MACEFCSKEILPEDCLFALHKKIIDDKEYVFCCSICLEAFEKKEKGVKE